MANSGNMEMDRDRGDNADSWQQMNTQDTMGLRQQRENLKMEQRLRSRRRQREREELSQRFAEDADFIKRKRETIERRMARKDLEQISEYDMKGMRHELAALEKDMRLLVRRRQSEEEEFQRSIEDDAKYLQGQMDAIEREERHIRRQHQKEEDELLEQQGRRQQLRPTQQIEEEKKFSTILMQSLSNSRRDEAKVQSEQGIARSSMSPDNINIGQSLHGNGMTDMTDSELQAQLQSLQKEISKRNIKDKSLESALQISNISSEDSIDSEINIKGLTGANGNENLEGLERANTLNADRSRDDYADGNTTKRKPVYQTIDKADTTNYSIDTSNVKDRNPTSSEKVNTYQGNMSSTQQKEHEIDATENRSDMMESIDKVIDELDRRLTKLKEESFKYKYGQPVERTVHFEKDGSNFETSHTERKLEGTYLDPKDMERDIKYDMRSTPKYTEEKIENAGYGHDGYEDRRIKDDARYRYSTYEFGRIDNRPLEDYRLREKPLHIRFVERYDRKEVDDSRQMTENINIRDKGAVLERDRIYDNVPYHGDMDSQQEAAHRKRIDHLHQREQIIAEQERALAEKERVLARKRAILKQEAEAQRIKKSADLEEQEILERERRLQERLNRMKESERELEILEISLKQPTTYHYMKIDGQLWFQKRRNNLRTSTIIAKRQRSSTSKARKKLRYRCLRIERKV